MDMYADRTARVATAVYLIGGLAWALLSVQHAQSWVASIWFVTVAAVGARLPGPANQVSLARAYLAAPALFYADWVHPIGDRLSNVRAYRARLLARPSVTRTVDEARPYRKLFPPGAPDRD